MEITLNFSREGAKRAEYFLRRRYKSKAGLKVLGKLAILTEAAAEADMELAEINEEVNSVGR